MERGTYGETRSVFEVVNMVAGLLFWAAHLGVIYGMHALACAHGWSDSMLAGFSIVHWIIATATVAALLGCALVLTNALRDLREGLPGDDAEQPARFLAYTTATIASFAMLAIIWEALPAFFIVPCT
jgi:hypothetical protein